MKRKPMITLILGISTLVLAGPLALYPAYTGARAWNNERSVVRDAAGIRAGAQAYTVGEGEVTLLMVHGFASSPAVFQRMAAALAERGYRCRVMRLPGFGEWPGNPNFSLPSWRAALDAEIKSARASSRQVWLIGHSMGATLALDGVARGCDVEGVVLVTPLIEVSGKRSILLPPRRWFDVGQHLWSEKTLIETAFPVDIHDPVPGLDEKRDLYLPVAAYREMFAAVDRIAGRAETVRCPVLMAVATRDLVVDSAAAVSYFERIAATQKQLLVMPESGHVLPMDRGWLELVSAVDDFVLRGKQ